tara:strand:- start:495 stop:1259 length:765 start_codon:yes stop_codon:yes gene_type:complete
MKFFFIIICILIFTKELYSRNIGETEILTDDGIEVFQKEKYYLLKKNVKIESDTFSLKGDNVKVYFEKDLYDIKKIVASGNVNFNSSEYNLNGLGNELTLYTEKEEIIINGIQSKLIINGTEMKSDGNINVNNLTGEFFILGDNSSLLAQEIYIIGEKIDGIFSSNTEVNEIKFLDVKDKNISYIKSDDTEMYAKHAIYKKEIDLIELKEDVKIIRDGETISGDYGTLDTKDNSYKVKSNSSNKVKVVIINSDE